MKKNISVKKIRIYSVKFKMTMIMAAVVASVVGIVCVLNLSFLGKYYTEKRKKDLASSFEEMKTACEAEDETGALIRESIQTINGRHNINVFVLDSSWNMAYSTNTVEDTKKWLQSFMFSTDNDRKTIEETDAYTIVQGYDSVLNLSYLVLYGTLDNGVQIVMQITLESIAETVAICNRFVILVGCVVFIVSIIVVYLISAKFTRPFKELSNLAEDMSEMNFEAKYTGKDRGEVGLLGHSMNVMSEKLQENISRLKSANLSLQKDIEIKNRNEAMRHEFLSNVSHELKTPIALIQGYAEGLKEGITENTPDRDYYCDVIIDESKKMNRLVKNLLTLNQIEYGKDPLEAKRFNIIGLLSEILRSNRLRFDQNRIRLNYREPEPVYVWCDELQVEEVITNYLSNAINHCDGDKTIRVEAVKNGSRIRISVFNTGTKIPEEELDRIWEKFYKVDKARTREYGGNGIGLSIVKAILVNYQGKYGVFNEEDGVNFWFELECETGKNFL